ncbi:nuclear transport factor 2 family protein [Actinocorallia libanotica]|uniref:SnoaL-like domain-containing protein n=1 Tax=Actinocorallia libanotica TaxID=46162 RepID=A0ABP4BYG5_9ACTN
MTALSPADEIRNLMARFAFLADGAPDLGPLLELLTEDAEWVVGDAATTGRAAIGERLGRSRAAGVAGPGSGTRHLITTLEVTPTGEDAATARSYWLLVAGGDTTACRMVGEYHDTLRRTPDGWRISRRKVVVTTA